MQQHRDIEKRSIYTIENQLIKIKNEHLQKWGRNTTVIVDDSMLSGIEERRISKKVFKRISRISEISKLKISLELQPMTCMIISSHCEKKALII